MLLTVERSSQATALAKSRRLCRNLLDRRYASFGILGTNVFTGEGRSFDPDNPRHEQFRGYGAPRSLSVGMQIAFGGA